MNLNASYAFIRVSLYGKIVRFLSVNLSPNEKIAQLPVIPMIFIRMTILLYIKSMATLHFVFYFIRVCTLNVNSTSTLPILKFQNNSAHQEEQIWQTQKIVSHFCKYLTEIFASGIKHIVCKIVSRSCHRFYT